jgi:hypothetical protein
LQDPDQSTGEADFFCFKETSFHEAETPLCSTANFHDAETSLCSTTDFHDAETPLMNTGDFLPDAETPLFNTFRFFPFPKQPHLAPVLPFSLLSLKHHYQQLFIAETPLPATFHHFSRC